MTPPRIRTYAAWALVLMITMIAGAQDFVASSPSDSGTFGHSVQLHWTAIGNPVPVYVELDERDELLAKGTHPTQAVTAAGFTENPMRRLPVTPTILAEPVTPPILRLAPVPPLDFREHPASTGAFFSEASASLQPNRTGQSITRLPLLTEPATEQAEPMFTQQPALSEQPVFLEQQPPDRNLQALQQRIQELELMFKAQEDATREVIRQTFFQRGSQINDFVTFGGTFEGLAAISKDFEGVSESDIILNTAQVDFEIKVTKWSLASIILEYVDGRDILFPTNLDGLNGAFVDRINVDTAYFVAGDLEQCPLFMSIGRIIPPFGISTGDPVADVLNIDNPLTVEVFEFRKDALLIGYDVSRPVPPTATMMVTPRRAEPVFFAPLIRHVGDGVNERACYPPIYNRPVPPGQIPINVETIYRYNAGVYFYNGATQRGPENHIQHMGATTGIKAIGYGWSVDMDFDFTTSVFDSRFLEFEYRNFIDQISYVPGMAAHVKTTRGPFAFVFEWDGAINDAQFVDDAGNNISIAPGAWTAALAYQFDWNPLVTQIGSQGSYVTISYSESKDLAGVTREVFRVEPGAAAGDPAVTTVEQLRVGFVPEQRFSVGIGEWITDGVRIAFEYSHVVDYSVAQGGTGRTGNAWFGMLTYTW